MEKSITSTFINENPKDFFEPFLWIDKKAIKLPNEVLYKGFGYYWCLNSWSQKMFKIKI